MKNPLKTCAVYKIWDIAQHNAFTDCVAWKDQLVVAFREGTSHISKDGKKRVIKQYGHSFVSCALISLSGYDLRDPCIISDSKQLVITGGACSRTKDNSTAPTSTFISTSRDSINWSHPQIVTDIGRWIWRVCQHPKNKNLYGFSYGQEEHGQSALLSMEISENGKNWTTVKEDAFDMESYPSEAAICFSGSIMVSMLRTNSTSYVGSSRHPFKKWEWEDLEVYVDSPCLLSHKGKIWGAGRRKGKTGVFRLHDLEVEDVIKLPSGGDNAYPGLAVIEDSLYITYYSSHEGKASIYVARMDI